MTISGYCSRGFRPVPSWRKRALHDGERVRGKIQNQQKEDLHRGDDHRSVGEQALIGLVAQAEDESVAGEEQGPEQQRAFLSGPEHGELVGGGQIAVAVMENVGDGEVVVEGGRHENDAGQQHGGEGGDAGAAGGFARGEPKRHPCRTMRQQACQESNTHSGQAPAGAQSFRFETSREPHSIFDCIFSEKRVVCNPRVPPEVQFVQCVRHNSRRVRSPLSDMRYGCYFSSG